MIKKKLLTDRSEDLQAAILEQNANQLAEEIDAEILRGMLVGMGWHEVKLWVMTHEQGQEIDDWTKDHVKGKMWTRGLIWLFENEQDAMWFKLRWLG